VEHGLYIKNGYLIFLGIVIMNLKKCHDTQPGVCAVYNTRPTVVYIPSESVIGLLRTLPRHHRYIYLQIGRAANLQDSQITKVAIITNRLQKLVASTLRGGFTHVKPMVPCPTPTLLSTDNFACFSDASCKSIDMK